jgi:hypothetical protein
MMQLSCQYNINGAKVSAASMKTIAPRDGSVVVGAGLALNF